MGKEKTSNNRTLSPWLPLVICVILAILFLVVTHFIPKEKKEDVVEFSSINRICELATLRCYFHNVGERQVDPDRIFQYGLFKYGYKKFWIEYSGIVTVGIDGNKVIIEQPDENGVVRVFVPEAEVLDIDADYESMGEPITETGMFTSITSEEQATLFSEEQKNMKEKIAQDTATLNQARYNAKIILENYVKNIGNLIGKRLTVEWMESIGPNTNSIDTAG